jgi:hypothetical protein
VTRNLLSLVLACAIAASTMPTTACNSQTALTELEKFGPVITNLLTVACEFNPTPLCGTGAALLTEAQKHVVVLWQAYLAAQSKGTATPALWNDLNSALDVLISHSSDVFSLAHVVNGQNQRDVLAMASATEALLAVIESLLPPNPAPTNALTVQAMARPARLGTFLPKPAQSGKYDATWFKQWQKDYNAIPAVQLHKMQVHTGMLGVWMWSTPSDSLSGLAVGHRT